MEPLGRSLVRRDALRLFLSQPGLETHPRELARRLNRAAPPVVRELNRLEELGILTSRRVGPLRRYRLAASPQAAAVRNLVDLGGQGHDERLLRLHARVAQKLRQDPERVIAKARSNLARWHELDARGNEPWIRAWSEIIDRGPAEVALQVVGPGARMRELRQSSPFAGVLTIAERLQVLRGEDQPRAPVVR
jgi:DNA-binding MarR family transcriptional regulator